MPRWRPKLAWIAVGAAASFPIALSVSEFARKSLQTGERPLQDSTTSSQSPESDEVPTERSFLGDMAQRLITLGKASEEGPHIESQPPLLAATERRLRLFKRRPPPSDLPHASIIAQQHMDVVNQLRNEAETAVGHQLSSRFTDAEIMRYAVHHGYLRAHDDTHRTRALSHAYDAIIDTVAWLENRRLASEDELKRYSHLIWWEEFDNDDDDDDEEATSSTTTTPSNKPSTTPSSSKDTTISTLSNAQKPQQQKHQKRPTLHVDIGTAAHECRGPEAIAFAEAVISHVEHGIRERCSDDPTEGYDRVDVVTYAAGASTFAASRVAGVLRAVVSSLARHFPGRLHELTLLDLPRVLTWVLKGVTKLVHSETARKVQSLSLEEFESKKRQRAVAPSNRPPKPPQV